MFTKMGKDSSLYGLILGKLLNPILTITTICHITVSTVYTHLCCCYLTVCALAMKMHHFHAYKAL